MNKVAILIPTYNRAQFLSECLEELLHQSTRDFSIIVYDDGSTDNTAEMIKEYPEVIYFRSDVNHGVGFARNELFAFLNRLPNPPKYLMWQDSDDFSHRNRIEYMVGAIEAQDVDICFSHMFFFSDPTNHRRTRTIHKVDVSKYKPDQETLNNNMNFATAIFKTELIRFQFREDVRRNEDGKWMIDLINNGIKIGYLKIPLYYCRRHPGRLTVGGKF